MSTPQDTALPLILDIKAESLDDGPGIRSVIFFKGCPLSCVWCHNPESKKRGEEISFDARVCVNCGTCREACPEKALSSDNGFYIEREKCTLCYACVAVCPSGALDRVGKAMSVAQILSNVLPDIPFYNTSGGGVTLSGGEPCMHMAFTAELLRALKAHHIHTLLETCGHFDFDRFMVLLYPHLDAIYFDIKIMDSETHQKYCGLSNERILKNFSKLSDITKSDGKTLLARTPLIPGITDTDENIRSIAAFLKARGRQKASLLPYHPLWHEKCDKIGVDNPYKRNKAMTSFPDRTVLERCISLFAEAGIHC